MLNQFPAPGPSDALPPSSPAEPCVPVNDESPWGIILEHEEEEKVMQLIPVAAFPLLLLPPLLLLAPRTKERQILFVLQVSQSVGSLDPVGPAVSPLDPL